MDQPASPASTVSDGPLDRPAVPQPLRAIVARIRQRGPAFLAFASVASVPVLVAVWWFTVLHPWHDDSYAFWSAWRDGRLYPGAWEPVSEYVYSPAFAQAFWPLTRLPWKVVNALWSALQLAALTWMLGPVGAVLAIAFPVPRIDGAGTAVFASINNGNPMILTAAAITLGLTRWPAAFAYVLLTKVSAGIGILWFAARHEWRRLAIALGVTTAIAAASFVIAPHLWLQWGELLYGAVGHSGGGEALSKERFLPVPLSIRGSIGLALVLIAAWRGRLWLVPIGCFLALPDVHLGGFAVLTAAPAVWLREHGIDPWGRRGVRSVAASIRAALRRRPAADAP